MSNGPAGTYAVELGLGVEEFRGVLIHFAVGREAQGQGTVAL
jgi:hypothetical protein